MNKISIILLVVLLVTGCNSSNNLEETITSEQALTVIAMTVDAELAKINQPTATFSQTPTPEPSSTSTPSPTTSPTTAATASQTSQSGNPPGQTSCDDAVFVTDVTAPDGTEFLPGEAFTKTWQIQNIGSCTWTSDYSVFFVDGSIMEATSPVSLTIETVVSGALVDISVGMVAPEIDGSFTGYWRMQNASGEPFGVTFYVEIVVTGSGGDGTSTPDGPIEPTESVITPTPTRTRRFEPRKTPTP